MSLWQRHSGLKIISSKGGQIEEEVYLKCSRIQIQQIPNPVAELCTRNKILLDCVL